MGALVLTARQAFEVTRLLDRIGNGIVSTGSDAIVTVLMDEYGTGSPNLALELDRDGSVVARQALDPSSADDVEKDEFSDLADEESRCPRPLTSRTPARRSCAKCPEPFGHDGFCTRCGRSFSKDAPGISRAA